MWTIALKTDGTLWATGDNTFGQLGQGDQVRRNLFTAVMGAPICQSIHIGGTNFIAISGSAAWGCGSNINGSLGFGPGDVTARSTIEKILYLSSSISIKEIRLGNSFTMVVDTFGDLWSVGSNWQGQLGRGNTTNLLGEFKQNTLIHGIEHITCGQHSTVGSGGVTLLIKQDGTLWHAGDGQFSSNDHTAKRLLFAHQLTDKTFRSVNVTGNHNAYAVTTEGELWVMGVNQNGQLGLGDKINRTAYEYVSSGWDYIKSGYRCAFGIKLIS